MMDPSLNDRLVCNFILFFFLKLSLETVLFLPTVRKKNILFNIFSGQNYLFKTKIQGPVDI